MKKIALFTVLIALVVFVLSSCGGFFGDVEMNISSITSEPQSDGSTKIIINYTDETIEPHEFIIPAGKEGETGKNGNGISGIKYKYFFRSFTSNKGVSSFVASASSSAIWQPQWGQTHAVSGTFCPHSVQNFMFCSSFAMINSPYFRLYTDSKPPYGWEIPARTQGIRLRIPPCNARNDL